MYKIEGYVILNNLVPIANAPVFLLLGSQPVYFTYEPVGQQTAIYGDVLYTCGDTSGATFPPNYIRAFNIHTGELLATSVNYTTASPVKLRVCPDFVFVGSLTTTFRRYPRLTLEPQVTSSPSYGGSITDIALDPLAQYVYACGQTTNRVRQYDYETLVYTEVQSENYGSSLRAVHVDGDYIYTAGDSGGLILVLNKNDLTTADTISHGGIIYDIDTDDDYIYAGGSSRYLKRYDKQTLAFVDQSLLLPQAIMSINVDDDRYVYVATNVYLYIIDKSDMTLVSQTLFNTQMYTPNGTTISKKDKYIYTNSFRLTDLGASAFLTDSNGKFSIQHPFLDPDFHTYTIHASGPLGADSYIKSVSIADLIVVPVL